jgi:hypothetical protein
MWSDWSGRWAERRADKWDGSRAVLLDERQDGKQADRWALKLAGNWAGQNDKKKAGWVLGCLEG